jgi:dTDP-4-dehydrorhamnose 3,5-epimerase
MIQGVVIKRLSIYSDERGNVKHMLRSTDPEFEKFGEIYFSCVYPGVVKGWHLHKIMTLNYTVVSGMIKLVLYDDRPESNTHGELQEIFMGTYNYVLVKIPPLIWNGFKGIGVTPAIVANCATIPYDPDEIVRKNPFAEDIPYDWSLICK